MIIHLRKKHIIVVFAVFVIFVACVMLARASFQVDDAKPPQTAPTTALFQQLRLPVIMYHQVMNGERNLGKYVLSSDQLKKDLEYIRSEGYTTVNVSDIVGFVLEGKQLPEKCVMLTFDDGFESVYAIVEPMMREYGMCAVTSVIGAVADEYTQLNDHTLAYSYLTWQEVSELSRGEVFEVHNHTYNMHGNASGKRKGMSRLSGEDESDYLEKVTEDLWLCEDKLTQACGEAPCAIFYPYGLYNSLLEQLIKTLGYKASFVCEERVNTLVAGNAECLYNLGRYNRPSGISSEEFFKKLL